MKLDFRQRLLATTLLVGASVLATPAFAQDVPPPAEDTPAPVFTTPSGPVEGQPTPVVGAEGEAETAGDIIVTGSRIPQPNLESVAPVTVVTAQDIKLQGVTRVEDLLNSLPSVVASQASTIANGSDGTATVDLRGLGTNRTLVLVNGRRLTPGDPGTSAADLNFIPSTLVKRVEVLTGGASSTYGADAVAGVVNFIMDTNFTGIRFDGQVSAYQHNNRNKLTPPLLEARTAAGFAGFSFPRGNVVDGAAFDGTVSIGTGFDDNRGHAVVYFGYRKVKAVTQDRRDYSACTIQNTGSGANQCGGSATSAEGNVILFNGGTSTFFNIAPGRTLVPGLTRYNFAPTNYFQRPDERYTAGLFANYEITPAIKPYMEFMFMDDRTVAQIAPSGDFGNTLTINCDNPLLSPAQFAIVCAPENLINNFIGTFPVAQAASYNPDPGAPPIEFFDSVTGSPYNKAFFQLLRRNVEGGPRQSDIQHTSYRGVLGTKGDLSKAWSYDAYWQYGRTNFQLTYSNEFSVARLNKALDVVDSNPDPLITTPVCRSFLDGSDPLCVPYDVLGNNVTPEALAYLSAQGFQRGMTSEQVANVSFTGLLGEYGIRAPWAEDGVGVNIGFEYRKESLELQTDNAFRTGDLTGQGAPTLPITGNFHVLEYFAETQIPIVQDNMFHELTLSAGYRKSYYSIGNGRKFNTDTYKIGLEFAPIRDVRFRGAYNRAVRAPNIQELFATNFVGLDGSNDPCAGLTDANDDPRNVEATDFGCLAQGMVVGQSTPPNPAGQYNGLLGGNPNLTPEKSTTKTVGVVLQPRFLPRFAMTVDYFDIKVDKAIQGFGADAILADCMNSTATTTQASCALINRDASGSLWLTSNGFVIDLPSNAGSLQTKGFEVSTSYSRPLGKLGTLSTSSNGTLLRHYKIDNGLTPIFDCAGLYGTTCSNGTFASAPLPKWRSKSRVTLTTPQGVGLSLQWRHIGKVTKDSLEDNPSLAGGPASSDGPGAKIKAQNYFDLATTFTFGDHYNFRLGVNNIFDRQPPLVTSGSTAAGSNACPAGPCNGNTYPAMYDALGRYLYAGVTLDF